MSQFKTPAFEQLTQSIEADWNKQSQNLEVFPEIATRALKDFDYDLSKEQLDQWLAEWFLKTSKLPEQVNVHNTFGQPPITLFNNGRFVLDIYIWLNFDTSIHSHGFRGAFKVLHGSSLHETFSVDSKKEFFKDAMTVDLKRTARESLQEGETRSIEPEKKLTHRVIHLENPTVTLCARTVNEVEISQWHYFINGLAIQKKLLSSDLVKKIYFTQYLLGQNKAEAEAFLKKLLDSLDTSVQMNLYEDLWRGSLELTEDSLQFIVDAVIERHGDTEWFKLYEEANPELLGLVDASHFDDPFFRLLGHFINSGDKLSEVLPHLEKAFGQKLTVKEVASALKEFQIETAAQTQRTQNFLKV